MDSTTGCMGVGGYGDMDGGTKLKILTKRKEIVPDGREGTEKTVQWE